jgi:hypothetical protein
MKTIVQTVKEGKGEAVVELASVNVTVAETAAECVEMYGEEAVVAMIEASLSAKRANVAKVAAKKEGATEESIQAAVDAYKPGQRSFKATPANYMKLFTKFSLAGEFAIVTEANEMYNDPKQGLVPAFNFLMEKDEA